MKILFSLLKKAYALRVQPHAGLALIGYKYIGTQSAPLAAFLCAKSFGIRLPMVKLEGDASARAGSLCNQSINPLQLCHPHLIVIGKASMQYIGVTP